MTRTRLPDRRPSWTVETQYQGRPITVTIGLDPLDAQRLEVFADGAKIGCDLAHLISDLCVVISVALQHGATPDELRGSLGTLPFSDGQGGRGLAPASIAGVLLDAVAAATSPQHRLEGLAHVS